MKTDKPLNPAVPTAPSWTKMKNIPPGVCEMLARGLGARRVRATQSPREPAGTQERAQGARIMKRRMATVTASDQLAGKQGAVNANPVVSADHHPQRCEARRAGAVGATQRTQGVRVGGEGESTLCIGPRPAFHEVVRK